MSNKTKEVKTPKEQKKEKSQAKIAKERDHQKELEQEVATVQIGGEEEEEVGVINRPYWVDKQKWAAMTDEQRLALVEPNNINPVV